jgi:hypothetical protein
MSRLVIDAAVLVPQLLDLDQTAFGQPRLRIIRQGKTEQLSAKLGERYAEFLVGIRVSALHRASPKCCATQGVR